MLNAAAGATLVWVVAGWNWISQSKWPYAAVGLAGVALMVLFGLFHLLTALWRQLGVQVYPQWQFLPGSQSLADYWSRRWNRAVHDFVRHFVYGPLRARWGPYPALFSTFLFSGLVHDLVVSVPAGGGYGLPTLYFLVQGAGIVVERRLIRRSWQRRLCAWVMVLVPLPLLFHRPFVERVVVPQLNVLRAGSVS